MMDEGSVSGESDVGAIDLSSPEERRRRRVCTVTPTLTHTFTVFSLQRLQMGNDLFILAKGVGLGLNVSLSVDFNDHLPLLAEVFFY